MAELTAARAHSLLARTVGPAPWYWNTFPAFLSHAGQRFAWSHQGEQGALSHVVSLSLAQEPETPRLALNSYCRPFLVPPSNLGVWCPEGRSLRVMCFDPDTLKAFDFAAIAGWFKQSSERVYAATAPIAELDVPLALGPGTHQIDIPPELSAVEELIAPTTCKATSANDPAFALWVFSPQAARLEVLPQRWFTAAQYNVGPQWITRAARDPESQRILGECFGVGTFVLQKDGCRLERWLERA
jgi:hypothetical protein